MFYIQVSVKFKYFTHFNTLVTQFKIYVIRGPFYDTNRKDEHVYRKYSMNFGR